MVGPFAGCVYNESPSFYLGSLLGPPDFLKLPSRALERSILGPHKRLKPWFAELVFIQSV